MRRVASKALMMFRVLEKSRISSVAEKLLTKFLFRRWSRDSSVDTATRYGLDGPGIESRFSAPVRNGSGACPASYTTGTLSFPGVQRPGGGHFATNPI